LLASQQQIADNDVNVFLLACPNLNQSQKLTAIMLTLEFQVPSKGAQYGKWGLTPWTLYSLLKVFAFSDSAGTLSRSQVL
jgi:hypothetical protein